MDETGVHYGTEGVKKPAFHDGASR